MPEPLGVGKFLKVKKKARTPSHPVVLQLSPGRRHQLLDMESCVDWSMEHGVVSHCWTVVWQTAN